MNNQGSTNNPNNNPNTGRHREEEEKKKREGKGQNKPGKSDVTGSYGRSIDDGNERDYGVTPDQQYR